MVIRHNVDFCIKKKKKAPFHVSKYFSFELYSISHMKNYSRVLFLLLKGNLIYVLVFNKPFKMSFETIFKTIIMVKKQDHVQFIQRAEVHVESERNWPWRWRSGLESREGWGFESQSPQT